METNQPQSDERRIVRPTESEEVSILREVSSLRSRIMFDMELASRRAGIRIQADNLLFISRDDLTVVSTAVAGLESIDRSKLECGANVLFTYFSLESASIAPGFYTVRISGAQGDSPAATNWKGQLFDVHGNFAAALPVKVEEHGSSSDLARPILTGAATEDGGIVDIHFPRLGLTVFLSQ